MKALALVVMAAIAGATAPAVAHAFLDHASPRAGDNLKPPPVKIELHFTEQLEPAFSGITVTDEAAQDVTAGPSTFSGAEMDVPLKPLRPGRYRVTWHAVSVDTHRTDGKYNFLVLP
ncbi:MAG TPA: copper resistance protein CopC [Bradyrhizobium sp.]